MSSAFSAARCLLANHSLWSNFPSPAAQRASNKTNRTMPSQFTIYTSARLNDVKAHIGVSDITVAVIEPSRLVCPLVCGATLSDHRKRGGIVLWDGTQGRDGNRKGRSQIGDTSCHITATCTPHGYTRGLIHLEGATKHAMHLPFCRRRLDLPETSQSGENIRAIKAVGASVAPSSLTSSLTFPSHQPNMRRLKYT